MKRTILILTLIMLFLLTCSVNAGITDGLVAFYPFNGNADDVSGNGLHGAVTGALLTEDPFGNANSAYSFDGIDDYIQVPNTDGAFDLTDAWSLSAWVKPLTPATDHGDDPLVWKRTEGTSDETFALAWGGPESSVAGNVFYSKLERASDDEDIGLVSDQHLPNQWYHVVSMYDGNNLKIYVNGILENTSTIGSVVSYTGPGPLTMGTFFLKDGEPVGFFDGSLDDVRIYDRALTQAEVTELHNVPEPTTLLLLGLGGLMLRRRKA